MTREYIPTDNGASGVQRIARAFEQARDEERAALVPYLTLGYPTPESSLALAQAAIAGGADLLELGVPFSDPLADGPVIQRAAHVALERGMSVARCLELAQDLRQGGATLPLIFMGYYNPILAYGEEAFCRDCRRASVDGLIVPDLPPEEAADLEGACREHGLALIYLLAPTSTLERIRLVIERSQGFVYLVSVVGITGPRQSLPADLGAFVRRVRQASDKPSDDKPSDDKPSDDKPSDDKPLNDKPLAVGFGISTPEQAGQVAALADGVVVGSALVRLAEDEDGAAKIEALVSGLRQAVSVTRRSNERLPKG
jgi:tryptophan synthase alpha chain